MLQLLCSIFSADWYHTRRNPVAV